MNAPAAPLPPERPGPTAEGWLTPCSWRLEDGPPGAVALPAEGNGGEPPLLWQIDRRQPLAAELMRQLADSLTPEERQRHGAYRLPADRERFLLGRGALRRLLGLWLGLAPEAVPFEQGPHGKPRCPIGPQFNLSHSGEMILLALHPCRSVGVDVERLRPALNWRAVARRMLSASERQALDTLPEAQRAEAFLACWCRLEARLKARGDGLVGLETLRQDGPRSGERRNGEMAAEGPGESGGRIGGTPAPWERIWDVAAPEGYRSAVALTAFSPR